MEVEVALLPSLPLVYRDSQVSMEISWGTLVFRPLNLVDEATLLRVEGMARFMLESLPDTPVQAVGINFGFRENAPPAHVISMFDVMDDGDLEQQGLAVFERRIIRRLTRGGDMLMFMMTYNGESIDMDFNFYTEARTNAVAQQAVEQRRVLRLRDDAFDILRQTYHLEIEGGDDGDHN